MITNFKDLKKGQKTWKNIYDRMASNYPVHIQNIYIEKIL